MTDGRDIRGGGRGHWAAAGLLAGAMAAAGCGGGQGAARPGGPPPAAVEAVTLGNAPGRADERVHRHRQVAPVDDDPAAGGGHSSGGFAVESGDRVTPGTVLFEIDAERQQAGGGDAASRCAPRGEADLGLAQAAGRSRQDAARRRRRLSQQEYDQAQPRR